MNLKKAQENTAQLAELLKDDITTSKHASDNLVEAMAEITTHWVKILTDYKED